MFLVGGNDEKQGVEQEEEMRCYPGTGRGALRVREGTGGRRSADAVHPPSRVRAASPHGEAHLAVALSEAKRTDDRETMLMIRGSTCLRSAGA